MPTGPPWRLPKLIRRDRPHQPASDRTLALGLPDDAWSDIRWRECSEEPLASRFARVRVRRAHRACDRSEACPEAWLLIAWPLGEDEPSKDWLSTCPESMPLSRMVQLPEIRWRVERDYPAPKQKLGLGHDEERGFHHHLTLCASDGFSRAQRARIPPQDLPQQKGRRLIFAEVVDPAALALQPERDGPNLAATVRRRLTIAGVRSREMSLLCNQVPANPKSRQRATQSD
jgi:SRSO17 transposase